MSLKDIKENWVLFISIFLIGVSAIAMGLSNQSIFWMYLFFFSATLFFITGIYYIFNVNKISWCNKELSNKQLYLLDIFYIMLDIFGCLFVIHGVLTGGMHWFAFIVIFTMMVCLIPVLWNMAKKDKINMQRNGGKE